MSGPKKPVSQSWISVCHLLVIHCLALSHYLYLMYNYQWAYGKFAVVKDFAEQWGYGVSLCTALLYISYC